MNTELRATALLLVALAASVTHSETLPPDSIATTLPVVEVTALRGADALGTIPAATFVLSSRDLRASGAARISDVLRDLPGLFGYRQRGGGDVEVVDPRGFTASGESSYLKLLVNGQDVRGLENGEVDWDWLLPDDVERVEVVQGPGAWVYGDGSEGGIVNIVRPVPTGRLRRAATLRAGSFGLRTLGASGSGGGGAGGADGSGDARSWALRGSSREVDGWRFHSRERVYSAGGEVSTGTPRGDREAGVTVDFLDADRQDPGTLTADKLAENREQSETPRDFRHTRAGIAAAHVQSAPGPAPAWRLSAHLRGEDGDELRTLFFQPLAHHTRSWSGGGQAEWRTDAVIAGRSVGFQASAQADQSRLNSKYAAFDPDQAGGPQLASGTSWRTTYATSAGARVSLSEHTLARLNVRADLARLHTRDEFADTTSRLRTLSAVSPMLGVSHTIGAGTLYASASTAFRVPALYQLYDRRPIFVAPGVSVSLSNGELDPQRSSNVEAGGRWAGADGRSAMLSAYSMWVRDEIDFDLATLSYANISRSWHRGIESAVTWPLPGRLTARGAGAWMPTTFRGGDHDGRQINGVPLSAGRLGLAWAAFPAATADIGMRVVSRQWLDRDMEVRLPGFAVWDLGFEARHRGARVAARLSNVFDSRFNDTGYIGAFGESRFSPAAPRGVTVSLGIE